ncbi:hypothetical protein L484_007087 [Morus notabilis]|uniref:Uncharacterized protein n=1 Tax=Morus notabilis TaxID=981085 RepID=W9SRH0_9ROSA|nr:hypothetical protein L484_007087 [Morus notabilis]
MTRIYRHRQHDANEVEDDKLDTTRYDATSHKSGARPCWEARSMLDRSYCQTSTSSPSVTPM